MAAPSVSITKLDGNTGVASPSSKGVCAIIAAASSGTANQATSMSKAQTVLATFGYGVLTDYASYVLAVAKNPVVLIKATASTVATYSAMTFVGTGTSVPTATSATFPIDDFNVLVTCTTGGTRGTPGIAYTYSLDGGLSTSSVQALGSATAIVIPNSGVSISLATGTLVAGDTIACTTVGPKMSTGDLSTALEALRIANLPWEFVLVGSHDATSTSVGILDTWLQLREAEGRFRGFFCNSRMKSSGEDEPTFLTAMTTAFGGTASIRGCVGTDGGNVVSAIPGRGVTQKRQTALALAARTMAIPYGQDPAYVRTGPVLGFGLPDSNGNPSNHDENYYGGLDAQRLVTLRTFDRKAGTFLTNANVISTTGSDYVYVQHVRTMNRALELTFDVLTNELSRGVNTNPKLGPLGEVYVAEEDAKKIEQLVNQSIAELRGQVADLRFVLSRTDNIGSNGPVILSGEVQLSALRYAKQYQVNGAFVRTISVTQ